MKTRSLPLLALFLLFPLFAWSQRAMSWEEFVEYITENSEFLEEKGWNEEDGQDEDAWQDFLEELQQIHLNPIDINTATPHQLRSIPFLNEKQIEDILVYVRRYHGMRTFNELLLLPSISYNERRILPLFLTIEADGRSPQRQSAEKGLKGWMKFVGKGMKQELLTRVDIPFYHRKGYLQKKYRGSPIYNKVMYRIDSRHFSASVQAERDAGERGIDSYGGHLMLNDLPLGKRLGQLRLQKLVLGDYRVSFGQGLLLNQGFSLGKSFVTRLPGIRPQRSTDEVNFLRGAAMALSFGNFSLSAFYSHRRWDATLTTVSAEGVSSSQNTPTALAVKTLVRTGYHRTETELKKKGNVAVDVAGGHLGWQKKGASAGVTGYFLKSDKPFERGDDLYRQIYPQGNHFGGVSVDYAFDAYVWRFWGETAWAGTLFPSSNGKGAGTTGATERRSGLATLNQVVWNISADYCLTIQQRYYNRLYHSFFANAPSESGGVKNETGGMVRLDARPVPGLRATAYLDLFRSPWPRYGIPRSTAGWEAMGEAELSFSRGSSLGVRYRAKSKEVTSGAKLHHRLRLQWKQDVGRSWHFATTASLYTLRDSHGESIAQTIKFAPSSFRMQKESTKNLSTENLSPSSHSRTLWRFAVSGLYFHTTAYDSRITLSEPNLVGSFYFPSFYGHGLRGALAAQCLLLRQRLRLELKYSVTRYFDRQAQSSALQTIYSPVKNDLSLQTTLKI